MHQVLRGVQGGQEDDGDLFRPLFLLQDCRRVETVHIRHHHVEQYQVGVLLTGHLDTRCTVVGRAYLELLVRQQDLEQQHVADHIVDDQDFIIASVYFYF